MLDIEKLAQELVFLRDKLGEIGTFINNNQYAQGAFLAGCLHTICHNHAVAVSQLIPPKPVAPEAPKDEQPAV